MSWSLVAKLRATLAEEQSSVPVKRGGRLHICLIYPNRYRLAIGNLGWQSLYALLNEFPDVVCERAFLPEPVELAEYERSRTPLLSLESQRPVAEFDVVAFSISFESDFLNLPVICRLAGIPLWSRERTAAMPLVLGGGAALFLNPEPVADFFDLICLGEAEPLLPELVARLLDVRHRDRTELLGDLCRLPGCYVPSLYEVSCDAQAGTVLQPRQGAPATVRRLWSGELDRQPTSSVVVTPTSEFGEMQLVEISRGCPRGCRFCAAGFIYLPYRQRSVATVTAELDRALAAGRRIGLVAAAVGDYRGIGEVCQHILAAGGKVSVSSLRIDGVDEGMIEVLKASGHKTVALAPEGGSQRLRDLIRKGISEEQILAACDRLIAADILNLKLYFIIGLPTETDDDLAELVALVSKIRERVVARARSNRRLGEILLSVNPFIPKPFTPFQWRGMLPLSLLEKRVQQLHKQFGRMANVRLQVEGLKDAVLQALLARGSRELAPLVALADERGGWRKAAKAMELDVAGQVTRTIPLQERLPWDFIDSGNRELLVREYQAAFSGQG